MRMYHRGGDGTMVRLVFAGRERESKSLLILVPGAMGQRYAYGTRTKVRNDGGWFYSHAICNRL